MDAAARGGKPPWSRAGARQKPALSAQPHDRSGLRPRLVRHADDPARTNFLRQLPGYAGGRLTIHSADLERAGCFDGAFAGCHGVCHVSHVSRLTDPDYQHQPVKRRYGQWTTTRHPCIVCQVRRIDTVICRRNGIRSVS